jgi:hypothetical protein
MKYKLTVIKYGKNENYEAELAKFKEGMKDWGYRNEPSREAPSLEIVERSLEVFLTEEEYNKVKAEVIKVFK